MSPAYNITLKQERDTAVQYSDVLQNHTPETHIIWLTISPQYIQQKLKKKRNCLQISRPPKTDGVLSMYYEEY